MNLKRKKIIVTCMYWLMTSVFVCSVNAVAQQIDQTAATCPPNIPPTTNDEDFVIINDGEVLHINSRLVFMQCSLGQSYDGRTCLNEPTAYNWQQALEISLQTDFNDSKNWRLPNIKELSVITERACVRPAINEIFFPNTSPDDYWTSTPSILNENAALAIAFTNASHSPRLKSRSLFVRLVRTQLASE